jgi:antitoxin PrlF
MLRPCGYHRHVQAVQPSTKGQVNLRKELLAHLGVEPGQRIDVEVLPGGRLELHAEQATGTINGFIGLLAGRSKHRASLEEMHEAMEAGWAALSSSERKSGSASL